MAAPPVGHMGMGYMALVLASCCLMSITGVDTGVHALVSAASCSRLRGKAPKASRQSKAKDRGSGWPGGGS